MPIPKKRAALSSKKAAAAAEKPAKAAADKADKVEQAAAAVPEAKVDEDSSKPEAKKRGRRKK